MQIAIMRWLTSDVRLTLCCETQAQMQTGTELTPLQEPVPGSIPVPESCQNQMITGGVSADIFWLG